MERDPLAPKDDPALAPRSLLAFSLPLPYPKAEAILGEGPVIKARVGCPPVSLLESWDRSQGPRTGKGLSVQEAALSPSKSGIHLEGNTVLDIDPNVLCDLGQVV